MTQTKQGTYFLSKEYPVLYSYTMNVVLKKGTTLYNFNDTYFSRDKIIHGLSIRPQNEAGKRLGFDGKKLINNNALAQGFLTIDQNNLRIAKDIPLENLVQDWTKGHAPGSHLQVWIEEGFDPANSEIRFHSDTEIVNDEIIELTVYWMPREQKCF